MGKVILVVGEVTSEQYQPARLRVMRRGHLNPVINRINIDQLLLNESALLGRYSRVGYVFEEMAGQLEELDEHIRMLAEWHVASFGDLSAVVFDADSWNRWSNFPNTEDGHYHLEMAFEKIDPIVTFWAVRPDGSVEFHG